MLRCFTCVSEATANEAQKMTKAELQKPPRAGRCEDMTRVQAAERERESGRDSLEELEKERALSLSLFLFLSLSLFFLVGWRSSGAIRTPAACAPASSPSSCGCPRQEVSSTFSL